MGWEHTPGRYLPVLLVGICLAVGLGVGVAASPPTADFDYSPSDPNPDDRITLDASGSTDDGSIVSYEWDTDGDGRYGESYDDADDGETATVAYDTEGTYTVGLRVTDDSGNTDTTTRRIEVTNPAPNPSFDYSPSHPNPDDEITLDASASSDPDGSIVSYEWDTDGDGRYGESYDDADDGETATVAYDTEGTYTVSLRVTDNGGKSRTVTRDIKVTNPPPQPAFDYSPSSPNPNREITLDASRSVDPDGDITSYEWDTDGDGRYGESYDDADDGETTTVVFDSAGTYTVGLRVEDNGEKSATVTKEIEVRNTPPSASISFSPGSPNPDDEITLDAGASSDPDGEIVSYEWDTDGDGRYSESYDDADDGETATVTFDTGGSYTIGLRVVDGGGKTATTEIDLLVSNPSPTARFSATPDPDDGLRVRFDGTESSDPDGEVVAYEWFVDDQRVATGPTPTLEFDGKGTYAVELRVTDNGDATARRLREVAVSRFPTATIDLDPGATVGTGRSLRLTADASDPDGTVESYRWRLSDGRQRDGSTTTVSFEDPGEYAVSLTATDDTGRTVTVNRTLQVERPPRPEMDWEPRRPADEATVTFSATTPEPVSTFEWDFDGDGTFETTGSSPEWIYEEGGQRDVTLRAVGPEGVANTTTRTITVREVKPPAAFGMSPTDPRVGQPTELRAEDAETLREFEWDFDGDGTFDASGRTVTHRFAAATERQVTLRVTDVHGDTATARRTVDVRAGMSVEFSSRRQQLASGNRVAVRLAVTNELPAEPLRTRVRFAIPEEGIRVYNVTGATMANRTTTEQLRVPAGETRTVTVRLVVFTPGTYDLGATTVSRVGAADAVVRQAHSSEPLRLNVTGKAGNPIVDTFDVGFGVRAVGVALLALVFVYFRYR